MIFFKKSFVFSILSLAPIIISISFSFAEERAKQARSFELKGYYKSLLTVSETTDKEGFTGDLNRLRLELEITPVENVRAVIAYDNEVILGDVLDTKEFKDLKDFRENTYFDLSTISLDDGGAFWRHSIYRMHISYARGPSDITIGRQRVALGAGRIWNPEDLLNPVSPLQIERDERAGVDAVSFDFSTGPVSGVSLVYAPGRTSAGESFLIRERANFSGYDISGMLANFRRDKVLGLDFSGYIKGSGLRGEFTYTAADERADFFRGVLSLDHTFPSSLYILIEYLYNGGNIKTLDDPVVAASASSEITTKNNNFIGAGAGYDITPLLRLDGLAVFDLDDKSGFLSPSLRYNILEDLDLSAGIQLFTGKAMSEYGGASDLYYAELKLYF
ncbi:MAG: hypothetical protein Q7T24_07880 [Deltaproteobacteria bacterium]|nr:hypothetical protein [Deltaproteobacteria bacterium]